MTVLVDQVVDVGMVAHRGDGQGWGPSTCMECGWSGLPTFVDGQAQHTCPLCSAGVIADYTDHARLLIRNRNTRRALKVGRNQPCPCKSGKKYKRCHGAVA